MSTTRVDGLSQLRANVARVRDTTAASDQRVYMEAAAYFLDEFRARAPVGVPPDDKHPGLYRNSAEIREGGANEPYAVFTIREKQCYYWHFLEFGTSKLPARHIIRNLITRTRKAIAGIISAGVQADIEDALK